MEKTKQTPAYVKRKTNPFYRANPISKLFFCWSFPFLIKGVKKSIDENDLYKALPSHESKSIGDKLEEAWNKEVNTKTKPSFAKTLFRVFGPEFAKLAIFVVITDLIIQISNPLLVGKLMEYYTPSQTHMSKNEAYVYAWSIAIVQFINVLVAHHFIFACQHLGMKIRVAICSLMYRKSLKLSKTALVETTTGQIINLMSNDVNRFQLAPMFLHDLWAAPLGAIIVSYLLYANLGWASLSGIMVFTAFIPIQLYLAKLTSSYRFKIATKTDYRVRLMNEIICGIQVIKMYVWEKPFVKLVNLSRKLEIDQIRGSSYVKAITGSCDLIVDRLSLYICILTYILVGNVLKSDYVYVAKTFYGILVYTLGMFLPKAFSTVAETKISIQRIEKFLLYNEISTKLKDDYKTYGTNGTTVSINNENLPNHGVLIKDVSVKWDLNLENNTLNDIMFSASENQLIAIVGPVGSGKSTLLHVILKELPLQKGSLNINGTISYASQEPWLFGGSIRQNILFGQEYDEARYKKIVKVCALERDFSLFEYGDRTIVGERGVMLSGGQKARINLARAVYKEADIYLLDDPLSAVDTHVGKQLFNDCISGFLKNKCTILVTHQLQYLCTVDNIYLLENGKIVHSGNFKELKNSANDYLKRLESEPKEVEEKKIVQEAEKSKLTSSENLDEPEEVKEHQSSGKVSTKVYISYLKAVGHLGYAFIVGLLFLLTQIAASGNDYFVGFWINLEEDRQVLNLTAYNITYSEDMSYFERFKMMVLTTENCLYIYTGFMCCIFVITLIRSLVFFKFCTVASKNLHNNMFAKIVYNSMRFFNTNPSGRILNRFSKDIGAIDETLPATILDTCQIGLIVFGIVTVVCAINPWIIIPTVIIFTLFYSYRAVYLATSRNLKRIEGTTRSPIFTQLTSSLQGLTTIRAFGAQQILGKEFDCYQDNNSGAFYMFMGTNRTFGFWMDLTCVIYMGGVTLSFLFLGTETHGGSVGLAITQSLGLTGMLQWGMRQWSELENQMTSVERVVEYTDLETENHKDTRQPAKDWPTEGKIVFQNVSMQYAANEPFVLKKLSFTINPKEKVGIVGRTGAGKSSLISALFRLADIEGEIIIDGVDTKSISLQSLRSKISIIPQEPVLFSGSLRKNLDPFDEYEDAKLWAALDEVELKQVVTEMPLGLQSNISEGGTNFSVGQRQLLCLARAAIRNNKILVLDEATANVDPQTDELIQNTIRRKFADCTVLTIAHRLHTVMDSDKILVMDAGQAAEFDHPHTLLLNTDSIFYSLVKQTGKGMTENLMKIAEEAFEKTNMKKTL